MTNTEEMTELILLREAVEWLARIRATVEFDDNDLHITNKPRCSEVEPLDYRSGGCAVTGAQALIQAKRSIETWQFGGNVG